MTYSLTDTKELNFQKPKRNGHKVSRKDCYGFFRSL